MGARGTILAALVLLVGVGCSDTDDSDRGEAAASAVPMPEPPTSSAAPQLVTTTNPVAMSGQEREVLDVVGSLSANSGVGFAPEALAAVDDLSLVLPDGASVEPDATTMDVSGDLASVDAVVRATGQPDQRYWVFLEQRDGAWLVYMTVPLTP